MPELNLFEIAARTKGDKTDYAKLFQKVMGSRSPLALDTGPWLAGGSVRRLIEGQVEYGGWDFDIFFKEEESFSAWMSEVERHSELICQTPYAVTFRVTIHDTPVVIQLINKRYYASPDELLNDFDFTMAQCITNGEKLIVGDTTLWDIATRTLQFHPNYIQANHSAISTVKRIAKFTSQGYKISNQSIGDFLRSVAETPACIDLYPVSDDTYEQELPIR